jgi:hypothetical protein
MPGLEPYRAGVIVSVLVFLRGPPKATVKAISERVASGSAVEASIAGGFNLKIGELRALPHVDPEPGGDSMDVAAAWTEERDNSRRAAGSCISFT